MLAKQIYNDLSQAFLRGQLGDFDFPLIGHNPGSQSTHPSYNIKQTETDYTIEIVAAGLCPEDIDIQLIRNRLQIEAKYPVQKQEDFLVKGMSSKAWARAFILGDEVEVLGTTLQNGILSIHLQRTAPKETAKKIPITQFNNKPIPLNG